MKAIIYSILCQMAKIYSYIIPISLVYKLSNTRNLMYTAYLKRYINNSGGRIEYSVDLLNPKYVILGNGSCVGKRTIIAAHEKILDKNFVPQIIIGDNVNIGQDCNISCCNKIIFRNGVRLGRKVMVNDNLHGTFSRELLDIQPNLRPTISKGPIIIDENVWIGEMVCILSGVHIGKGSIIAAGSIVTHDIPPYSLAAGVPAKVIKQYQE